MTKSLWLSIALVPCLAFATPAPEPTKDAGTSKADEQDVVCTRQKPLGSNMAKKVCTTAAQREAVRDKAQKDLQRLGSCASNDPGTCVGEL